MQLLLAAHPFDTHGLNLKRRLENAGLEVIQPFPDRKPSEAEIAPHLETADYAIMATIEVGRATLERCPRLKLLARTGVGLDGLDLAAFKELGILVTHTPGSNTGAVAELSVAMIIDALRGITRATERMRRGEWIREVGFGLEGRDVGLLGFGRVGRRLAGLLAPFGAHLLAHDILEEPAVAASLKVDYVPLDQLLRSSQVLSIHLPLDDSTRGMVDSSALERLPKGAVLVNTSRGGIVDETALLKALESGRLAAAAVDVYKNEPYTGPLSGHPHAILTSHMGASSFAARQEMESRATAEILAHLEGRPPQSPAY